MWFRDVQRGNRGITEREAYSGDEYTCSFVLCMSTSCSCEQYYKPLKDSQYSLPISSFKIVFFNPS